MCLMLSNNFFDPTKTVNSTKKFCNIKKGCSVKKTVETKALSNSSPQVLSNEQKNSPQILVYNFDLSDWIRVYAEKLVNAPKSHKIEYGICQCTQFG